MNSRHGLFILWKHAIVLLLFAGGMLRPVAWADENETPSTEEIPDQVSSDEEEKSNPEEDAIKAEFPFSFDDVSHNLVIIECKSSIGSSAGSGFVARMGGKTYIFTNQHVILGSDSIKFATVSGEVLKPTGVELSAERDIARLLIKDRPDALETGTDFGMGNPLAVFGNSEGAGVATELYGKVTGVGAELLEVTAEFVSGNSGSPVLNSRKEVIGIASYVRFSQPSMMTENTRFANSTRRFCYRIDNTRWIPVNWRQYNRTYGRTYRETEARWDSLVNIINNLFEKPNGAVPESWSDSELKSWANAHNRSLSRSDEAIGSSANALSAYCDRRARELEEILEKRNLTEFLRNEFEGYMHGYRYASQAVDYFGARVSTSR